MSFSGPAAKLCAILRVDLPTHDIRFSEGGEVEYDGDVYSPEDSVFGAIREIENFTAGEADEAPSLAIIWTPKDAAAAISLSQPSSQQAFVEHRILSIDRDTNAVLTNDRVFTGMVNTVEINGDINVFDLRMEISTEIDRLLNTDKGNKLSRAFHRSVWPGETGLDFMTGTQNPVPWGDDTQTARGTSGGGGPRIVNPRTDFR